MNPSQATRAACTGVVCLACLHGVLGGVGFTFAARPTPISMELARVSLPGPPAALVPADVDRDGDTDLVAAVAYTEWDRVVFDRVEDAVMITEVVPALFNRREIHVFLAENGAYRPVGDVLDVSRSVFAIDEGPSTQPVLALTPGGVAALRVVREDGSESLELEPVVERASVLAGAEVFLPRLSFAEDLTGDGEPEVLLPGDSGISVHVAREGRIAPQPSHVLKPPGERHLATGNPVRFYPLPIVGDLTGDGTADLLFSGEGFTVAAGLGDGRFLEPRTVDLSAALPAGEERDAGDGEEVRRDAYGAPRLAYLGDLDGDGLAEVVTLSRMELHDAGMRDELREAKTPRIRFAFHHLGADLRAEDVPYATLDAVGYQFGGGWPDVSSNAFADLDGDGRKDLVTITLNFSVLQALRVVVAKRISIGLDFHVWNQLEDGSFAEVKGLDLSEKLKVDLNDFELTRIAQFAGDFDGDSRADFVHLGRGRRITIHQGQIGARYSAKPGLTIELADELDALELVRVTDITGDGRADLVVTRPREADDPEETDPVRLEIYRTTGAIGEEPVR